MKTTHIRILAVACALTAVAMILPSIAKAQTATTTSTGTPLAQYMAVAWEGEGYLVTENGGKSWKLVTGNALSTLPESIQQGLKAGTKENLSAQATVSPNPASTRFDLHFAVKQPGEVSISLHDMSGAQVLRDRREVSSAGMLAHSIDASGLASGVYYYRLISGSDHIGSGTVTIAR